MSIEDRHLALRATPRFKVFQPIELRTLSKAVRAHMLDLSAIGALLHTDSPPDEGASVTITTPHWNCRGRIMWRSGNRIGVRFSRALSETELAHYIGSSIAKVRNR